jgi:hypothetical protein
LLPLGGTPLLVAASVSHAKRKDRQALSGSNGNTTNMPTAVSPQISEKSKKNVDTLLA